MTTYIIKRTEIFEGRKTEGYLQESGTFGRESTARIFTDWEKAEDYIDLEKSDPKYDKVFMGKCTFTILEARMTNLQTIRRQKGISQAELSRLSGVPLKTIQGYESVKDINGAAALTVHKLAQALEVESKDILELEI